uniref:Uncharacterized protein n=1 Tax=Pithovirus LCPAC201 TaxID=2506591 RepID=A0A481Z5D5_9VIRU|nr:MAG: hypothetical protein LCPAC201_00460 [Pithovirus LCPAC201]
MISSNQTFFKNIGTQGEITHIKYQWVTDPNLIKKVDRSLIPNSLLTSLLGRDNFKNRNLLAVKNNNLESGSSKVKLIIHFQDVLDLILEQISEIFLMSNQGGGLISVNLIRKDALQSVRGGLISVNLPRNLGSDTDPSKGLKKYLYHLEYHPSLSDQYQKIGNWINLINYPPLILSVDESKYAILPGEQDKNTTAGEAEYIRLQAIAGLRTVIKALVGKKEHLPIRNVIQDTLPNHISPSSSLQMTSIFIPYDQDNRMIYVSPEEERDYQVFHPLELYYGWRYLSDSPLTLYVIDKMPFNPPIRKIEGIYIIPTMKKYNAAFNQASLEIANLIVREYLTLNLEVPNFRILDHSSDLTDFMDHKMDIYSNLISRFGHKMITTRTDYSFEINRDNQALFRWCELKDTCLNENPHNDSPPENLSIRVVLYGPPVIQASCRADQIGFLASWLDDSVNNIIRGNLPLVTFRGTWQEIENGSKMKVMARLKYVAYLAYHDLVINRPYLSSSILLVDVLDDLSIVAPLTSQEEMDELREEIERISSHGNYLRWSIFSVTTQLKMVATRLILQEKFPHLSTFGVRIKEILYVVANQRIDPNFLTDLDENVTKYLQESSSELNYYLKNVPVVSLNESGSSSKKYINRDQFLRSYDSVVDRVQDTDELINPITPLSLSRVTFYPEGLMGLFDVNLPVGKLLNKLIYSGQIKIDSSLLRLKGLYKNPPFKKLIPIDFGHVTVEGFLPSDTYQNEWVMTVNVKLVDRDKSFNIIPLFDLSYNRIKVDPNGKIVTVDYSLEKAENFQTKGEELSKSEKDFTKQIENVTDWLWKQGWFLSSWGQAIINDDIDIETKIGPNGLIETVDILKDAYQDSANGEIAVNYLNQIIKLTTVDILKE